MLNADVFVYTGQDRNNAPQNVVRVLVDPSVTSIPNKAFFKCKKLTEVELREGLVEIGEDSFACCEHAITKIIIGFVNLPSHARFELQFSFTTTLRALEEAHSLAAYLPTSEFLPSSQWSLSLFFKIATPCSHWSYPNTQGRLTAHWLSLNLAHSVLLLST